VFGTLAILEQGSRGTNFRNLMMLQDEYVLYDMSEKETTSDHVIFDPKSESLSRFGDNFVRKIQGML